MGTGALRRGASVVRVTKLLTLRLTITLLSRTQPLFSKGMLNAVGKN